MFYWFHNNTRTSSSASRKRSLLKINVKSKTLRAWQAYQSLYYQTKLKPIVDAAYKAYLETVPPDTKPEKTCFAIMNQVVQKAFAEEMEEVKAEVEEYRQKVKEVSEVDTDNQDRDGHNNNYQKYDFDQQSNDYQLIDTHHFHRAIDRFPQTLAAMGKSFVEQTGWNLTCIAGGPNPRMGGKITTFA